MSEAKKASLTVLGGPLGGSRFVLPDDGEVTIGSGEDCSFRLDTPGVNPLHARVVLEEGRATVFSTGAERPLHINDNPLGAESAALRNGDILWLGVPGEDEVVMLQCILAPRPAPAPSPPATVAEPTPDIETQALWIDSEEAGPAEPPAPPAAAPPSDHEPLLVDFDSAAEQKETPPSETEFVAADEIAPVDLEGSEEAVVVEEEELFTDVAPTLVEAPPDLAPPTGEVLSAEPIEHQIPSPAAPAAPPPIEPTPPKPLPETPAPAARPSPPAASGPSRPAPAAPSAERPPTRPRRERPAPRRRPSPPERDREDEHEGVAPARSPVVLALAGFVGVLAVAILGWVVWRFVLARPAAEPTPSPVAAATAVPAPAPTTAPPAATPAPEAPSPEPTAAPTEPPAAAAAVPAPTPTPEPTPTPTPTPPPAAAVAPPAAAAPPAPPQPSPEELQAQQNAARVATLLGQADTALAARQYDAAIGHLDEALGLDPQNSRAQSTRVRAVALRDLANRRFVASRTRVQTEKAQGGGLAGFDTGDTDLRKAPDFQGRIEFEMNPASGVTAGDPWTLRIFVVNEGKKSIEIQGVDAVTQVNGAGGGGAVTPRTRQVPTQRRMLVGELSGTWSEGTTAWSTQVTITANKGDSLRASLTWR